MAYRTDGVDDSIKFAATPLAGHVIGPITTAYYFKRLSGTNRYLGAVLDPSLNIRVAHSIGATARGEFTVDSLSAGVSPSSIDSDVGVWTVLVFTWGGSGTEMRFHIWEGSSWIHGNAFFGSPTGSAPAISASDFIWIGSFGASAWLNADFVCAAIKKTNMTDAEVEAYFSGRFFPLWEAAAPHWLVGFEDSATVLDRSAAGTGDEVARVGTTLVDDPPDWAWDDSDGLPYWVEVMRDDPVGYWRLNEAAGATTANDTSAKNHDGTLAGGPTLGATGALASSPATALQFPASGTPQVSVGHHADFDFTRTSPFTLEGWVKGTGSGELPVVGKLTGVFTRQGWSMTMDAGKIRFWLAADKAILGGATSYIEVLTSGTYNDGAYHHVVCTYDGSGSASGMKVYVDGVSVSIATTSDTLGVGAVTTHTTGPYIGLAADRGIYAYSTTFDEIAVFAKELSSARVLAHYAAATGTSPTPPTIRETAALSSTGSGTAGSLAVTLPASRVVGDLLLIDVSTVKTVSGDIDLAATGWAVKHFARNNTQQKTWLWKICDGTESSPVTVTASGSNPTSTRWKARAIAITAGTFHPTAPFDASSGASGSDFAGPTTYTCGTFTPLNEACLAIGSVQQNRASVVNTTFDSPASELYDDAVLNHLCSIHGASRSAPAAEVPTAITGTWVGTSPAYVALTIVIRPAPLVAPPVDGAAALTGSGSLTADGTVISVPAGEADLTGLGTLTADGVVFHPLPIYEIPEITLGFSFGLVFDGRFEWEIAPVIVYGPDDTLPPPTHGEEPDPDPEDEPDPPEEPDFEPEAPEDVQGTRIAVSFTPYSQDEPDWTTIGG